MHQVHVCRRLLRALSRLSPDCGCGCAALVAESYVRCACVCVWQRRAMSEATDRTGEPRAAGRAQGATATTLNTRPEQKDKTTSDNAERMCVRVCEWANESQVAGA